MQFGINYECLTSTNNQNIFSETNHIEKFPKIIEVIVTHRERSFGNSKYSAFNKLFFGIFEVLIFSLRMKLGFYKIKQ